MRRNNHRSSSHADRTLRRDSAKDRAAQREKRSITEQLDLLDQRPGNAARERARLGAAHGAERKRASRQKRAKQRSAA